MYNVVEIINCTFREFSIFRAPEALPTRRANILERLWQLSPEENGASTFKASMKTWREWETATPISPPSRRLAFIGEGHEGNGSVTLKA
jgi:hypothetical protein